MILERQKNKKCICTELLSILKHYFIYSVPFTEKNNAIEANNKFYRTWITLMMRKLKAETKLNKYWLLSNIISQISFVFIKMSQKLSSRKHSGFCDLKSSNNYFYILHFIHFQILFRNPILPSY